MKKAIIIILLALPFFSKAQYTQIIAGPNITPGINFIYVGSLTLDPANASNCQKLKVSVIGNGWTANNIGETVFYIANRGGLSVNQVVTGGSGIAGSTLRAYQSGSTTSFYIQISYATAYYSMAVSSFDMGGLNSTGSSVTITTSASTPSGTDVTSTIAFIPVMITDYTGNISINTADSKGYKFAVNGTAIATSVTVKPNANWPDYVFKPTYKLPPLTDVKTYIGQNQHLPEMPSSADVEKNGINLGEMDRALVKKVEELTLYMIDKDKQVDELQKLTQIQQQEINDLKKQVSLLLQFSNKKP